MSNLENENLDCISIVISYREANKTENFIQNLLTRLKDSKVKFLQIIIGYDAYGLIEDDLNRIRDIVSVNSNVSIILVPCYKYKGKYESYLSDNEIYIQCRNYIKYKYVILSNDYIEFCNNYLDAGIASIDKDSEFLISGFAINWPDGVKTKYQNSVNITVSDYPGSLVRSVVLPSFNQWWLTNSFNKIFKSDFVINCLERLEGYYKTNTAHLELDDLLLSLVVFKSASKFNINNDIYTLFLWSDEDSLISCFHSDTKAEYYLNEISVCYSYIIENLIDNSFRNEFDEYFRYFLGRIVWRHNWCEPELTNKLLKVDRDIQEFSLDSFACYGVNIHEDTIEIDNRNLIRDQKTDQLKVKIYISMHNCSYFPQNSEIFTPIQVGASLANSQFIGMLHDNDAEDNISEKNRMYCEMTSQYYVWKNCKGLDYYGFWHYRRYLSFNQVESDNDYEIIYKEALNDTSIKESCIEDDVIVEFCTNYEIILPRKTKLVENGKVISVYEQWCNHFNKSDIDITIDVIAEKFPSYLKAVLDVMNSTSAVFCNMFIMDKEHFEEYSNFCFKTLFEVETRLDQSRYNIEKYRTLGHIAERLLAVYITYLEKYSGRSIKIHYALKVQYNDTRSYAIVEKPNKNKCVSIMLACDDKYMKYTDVILESIRENASSNNFYDIVICHRGISNKNQEIAKSIFLNCSNILLRFADVSRNFDNFTKLHIDRHLSLETYYRFLVLDIFKGYERVLYLDCDMIVNSDPAELFFTDMTDDQYIAAVRDYDFIAAALSKDTEFYYDKILRHIKIDQAENYFQAGVILFNLTNLSRNFTTSQLFETALSRNWFFHDQDVLNCLFNGHVKFIDDKWNVFSLLEHNSRREDLIFNHLPAKFSFSYQKSLMNPAIVHYAGVPKVWNDSTVHLGYLFWKYARNSPFYEKLNDSMINGEGERSGWLIFIEPKDIHNSNMTLFFSIRSVNEPWVSNYVVLDFIFMSNHANIHINTLVINYSLFPDDKNKLYTKVVDFNWERQIPIFDHIQYRIDDNDKSGHGLDLYVRQLEQYEGFSFRVRETSSRNYNKPYIRLKNFGFIKL